MSARRLGLLFAVMVLVAAACSSEDSVLTTTPDGDGTVATTASPATSGAVATTIAPAATTTTDAPPPPPTTAAPMEPETAVDTGADMLIDLAAGLGSVWATGLSGGVPSLYRVDPLTATVEAALPLADGPVDVGTFRTAAGDRFMWVVMRGTLLRVDPNTGVDGVITLGVSDLADEWSMYPWDVAAADGSVWAVVVDNSGFDPISSLYQLPAGFASPATVAALEASTLLGDGLVIDLVAAYGAVWVLPEGGNSSCRLLRFEPDSLAMTEINLSGGCATPHGSIAVGDGYVWVADMWSEIVRKVDPSTNTEVDTTFVPGGNGLVGFSSGTVWQGAGGPPFEVWGSDTDSLTVWAYVNLMEPFFGLTATDGAVWVLHDEPSQLVRLAPTIG